MLLKEEQVKNSQPVLKEDPRVVRTRQLIQHAFMDLFREKSFEEITIQEIADRATINRVTFYAHFQDKFALLEYTIREMIRQHLYKQLPDNVPFNPENMALLVRTVCEFLTEIQRMCPPPHGQMDTLMEKQIKAELYEILHSWLVETAPDDTNAGPTLEQTAMVTSWAIYGAAVQWVKEKREKSAEEYVEQVLPLILKFAG
jgi:AcrR family transcriptional regulator